MNVTYQRFNRKYLKSCQEIIKSTWPFHKHFINPKKPDYIYKYYILDCENWSEHQDLLIDEYGQVQAILFGSIEKPGVLLTLKYLWKHIKINAEIRYHILNGDLGNRKAALAVLHEIKELNILGESPADQFDSEVNLFIARPELRGKGYGKKLMDRYVEFCRENHLKSSFLWTTSECTYQFYDSYGFKLYKTFAYQGLEDKEKPKKDNTMIYYLGIE